MTNSNNDIEELEELLTELEGQEAQIVTPYSEEDDAVTRLMEAPLGDQDWMVQVTALDRRMMTTGQVLSELSAGKINPRTLVWRGGMDDWMPIARIDELSRASMPPVSVMPRPSYAKLAPPPPPPQPSQPMWMNAPPSAPLPPPPVAMAPPIGMAPQMGLGMAPGLGLPPPPALTPPPPAPVSASYGLPKPAAVSAPPPAPAMAIGTPSSPSLSSGNTTRPVAIDFSDLSPANDPPLQGKRWVMALSAVAIVAVFVTVYSLSSGGGEEAKETKDAKPQAVAALQPSSSAPAKEKPSPAPAPTPAPAAAAPSKPEPAAPIASSKSSDDEEESASSGSSASARQTAQARYSPRSEYRRRSRGSASDDARDEEESTPSRSSAPSRAAAPARAAAAAPSSAPAAEEEEAPSSEAVAVADEVDEAPKSTGKSSGSTFNREAAKSALDEAASQAKNCRPQGGPSGTGRVQVRYEPSGKVSNVTILTSKFDNTTAGSCVRMLFRRAKVPEFTGAPVVVVNKSFEIP